MAICKRDGCENETTGVQLVRADPPSVIKDWCRPHHVDERRAAGVLVPVEVTTNKATIMGVDGSENRKGDRIELDSEEIDIQMLVDLGFVKLIEVDPAERLAKIRSDSAELAARLAELRSQEKDAAAATETPAEPASKPAPKPAAPKA